MSKLTNSLILGATITGATLGGFIANKYTDSTYFYEKKIAKKEIVVEGWNSMSKPMGYIAGIGTEINARCAQTTPYVILGGIGAIAFALGTSTLLDKLGKK